MSSWSTVGPRLDIRWLQRWVKSWNSVQFSHLVVSNSLKPNELQHTRSPCPPPTPRAYPNSCPLSRWCHITISSSVIPFSSFLQSFPTSGSFLMSWPKYTSFSFSISSFSEYSGIISFRTDWIDILVVQGSLKNLLQHYSSKASILQHSAFLMWVSRSLQKRYGLTERGTKYSSLGSWNKSFWRHKCFWRRSPLPHTDWTPQS